MKTLEHKIDFAVSLHVRNANPNGDPLNGNRPRLTFDDHGEITDVAIKRKMRDRLMDAKHEIFVQADDRRAPGDTFKNLKERAEKGVGKPEKGKQQAYIEKACKKWFDVRAFGQVFPFKKGDQSADGGGGDSGVSIPVRGPVSIQSAFSVKPIQVASTQIVKGTSLEGDGEKRASDQMGMKHRVDGDATYVFYGSINPQLAERTFFMDDDALAIKDVLLKLFENDESTARPAGSMRVIERVWWNHGTKSGKLSSFQVHDIIRASLKPDGTFDKTKLKHKDMPDPEVDPGF
ncbi:MAG: type I-C CRISPR-associated protein Cas7/Csd2 [Flavobacteriales bacterium]|nr:type I-C CRISPR-associated protein Cas7/Csd2 [Flavobacteriales bacterium]MCC6542803.1 type I-C CRISPR-associated protein Cas7/Csd2 [Flavobacteriales bacterium]